MVEGDWYAAQRRYQAQLVLGDVEADFVVWSHRRWAAREADGWPAALRLALIGAVAIPIMVVALWASARYSTTGFLLALAAVGTVQLVAGANLAPVLRRRYGRHTQPETVVALYRQPVQAVDAPEIVVEVSPADATRLELDGAAVVIGDVEVDGHLGIVDGDYVIWPVNPPRLPVLGEPTWGASPRWD